MELVGAHDAVDIVAVPLFVVVGYRRPEAGDLQHHLGPVVEQELEVVGDLVVAPDVVEDGGVYVPLVVGEVRLPLAGVWVEVDDLCLFLPVGAALPGVHRPFVAGFFCGGAGFVQAPVTVHEKLAGNLRQPEVEERVYV